MASKKKVTTIGNNDEDTLGTEDTLVEAKEDGGVETTAEEAEDDTIPAVSLYQHTPLYLYVLKTLVPYISEDLDWRTSADQVHYSGDVLSFQKLLPTESKAYLKLIFNYNSSNESLTLDISVQFREDLDNNKWCISKDYQTKFSDLENPPPYKLMEEVMTNLRSMIRPEAMKRYLGALQTMKTIV